MRGRGGALHRHPSTAATASTEWYPVSPRNWPLTSGQSVPSLVDMATELAVGHARQVSLAGVALPPRLQQADYLDVFEITVAESDTRTPEMLAREALEQSAPPIREGIRFAHKAFLLFQLAQANSPQHVLGWRIAESTSDAVRLEADSPLMEGTLILRRANASTGQLITALHYKHRRAAAAIWRAIGPIHRTAAPYLMNKAVIR